MPMTLEQFIQKVREKEESKIKITTLQIENFGEVEFERPNTSVMLKFQKEIMASYNSEITETEDEENQEVKKIKTSDIEMDKFAKASSVFVYNSCSMLRTKEIREIYKKNHPEDIPLELFGMNEVIAIAVDVFNKFEGRKEVTEVEEDVKN
ncbi:hypothetical protein I6E36_08610 [Fusobacterium mortiferum]|uniref:hypothetical protein n=1 Tax=Fusobacterium mortiferum TaxID=850 RepID=UPI001F46F7B5|nr:hypothetical protein [Fusobacterium mortiferum]MCF2628143.1 hypothetical protein [Fusobacterium mortiferum]